MTIKKLAQNKSFSGIQYRYQHYSECLSCDMMFSIYLPEKSRRGAVPVLYWLSGLTCTDENFVTKAGAQVYADKYGVAIVAADTSPRGESVPDDSENAYDFGLGAGFYLNATQQPWKKHYQMYDYIVSELVDLIEANFPVMKNKKSISGHSMGGHGALTIAFKNAHHYQSVSAFSPIVAPTQCAWGKKAFMHYLGENNQSWLEYDACYLISKAEKQLPLLIDQGQQDDFLEEQLKTPLLIQAAEQADYPIQVRMQAGYDHSYFFIATFIEQHIAFHTQYLND